MQWILFAALVSSAPEPRVSQVSPAEAAAFAAKEVQAGSLIVSQGDCLAVKIYTQSPFTHVGTVVMRRGQPYVYDSANGVGVRCQTLANYVSGQSPAEIHLFQPRKPLSRKQAGQFEQHLDSQLGRPYEIAHHLTGNRADGLHCAEYVTDALIACDLVTAKEPSRVSPASLVEGLVETGLYSESLTLKLIPVASVRPTGQGWCSNMWLDTKECTRTCYLKLRGWVCCY